MPAASLFLQSVLFVVAVSQAYFNTTIVTGLWNVGRGNFSSSSRGYEQYLKYFRQMLQYDGNMIIFGSELQYNFTQQHRPKPLLQSNTFFVRKELVEFEKYWYTGKIWQVIKRKPETLNIYRAIELKQTPQYGVKMYNPVVMSKHRLLFEASQLDPFFSEYLLWIDGGFTHVIPFNHLQKHFYHKMLGLYQPSWFIRTGKFGFKPLSIGFKEQGRHYSPNNNKIDIEVLGYCVGGKKEAASTAYHIYENFLRITFENLDMNTDQATFVLMVERYPYFISSIKSIQGEVYYDLKISVEKQDLRQRHFSWREADFVVERDGSFIDPIQAVRVVELRDPAYFTQMEDLFNRILKSRVVALCLLIVALVIIRNQSQPNYPYKRIEI